LISGSAAFHLFQHYIDVGIPGAMIALAIGLYSLANGLSTGIWGYLAERISERVLGIASALAGGVLIMIVVANHGAIGAVILAAAYGLAVRGEGAVFQLIIARYYGRSSYGAISGTLLPIGYVGLGIGPLLGSIVRDAAGDYYLFLGSLVLFHLLGALVLFLARAPALPRRLSVVAAMQEADSAGSARRSDDQ
jgi:MFS family permease